MCWPYSQNRTDQIVTIAAAVAGGFQQFGENLLEIIDKDEVPPSGTIFRLLAQFGKDPILAKPALGFIAEIIYRYGRTGFDHIGTERDFWRLCHRDIVGSYIDVVVSNFKPESLIADFIGRANAEVGYAKVSNLPAYPVIMTQVMSLMLGNPMRAALGLVLFATIRENHASEFEASLTLACQIIAKTVTIGPQTFGMRRQKEAWTSWKTLSPLWAGILVEAKPWHQRTLIDVYSIQNLMLNVISDDERRMRAFHYAQWFCTQATTDAHKQYQNEKSCCARKDNATAEVYNSPKADACAVAHPSVGDSTQAASPAWCTLATYSKGPRPGQARPA